MIPIAYNVRNLAVRKATTAAAAGGLALVVFVFASARMLVQGVERTLGKAARPDMAIVLRKGSDAELASAIDEPQVGLILAGPEVARGKGGAPVGSGEVMVLVLLDKLGTEGFTNVQVRGVADNVLELRSEVKIVAGRAARPGTDEVIVGKAIRGRFKGLDLEQSFELRKNRPVRVVGVFEDGGSSFESEIWGDVATVRSAFGREGSVSSVRLRLASPGQFEAFKASVEGNKQLGLEAMRETDYYAKQSEDTATFLTVLGSVIAIFFSIGAMIGAMITMHASVAHRQREIGTLRALGFSRTSILLSFLLESILLALFGGAIGALASLAMGFVRFSTMNFASFAEIVFSFEPTAGIVTSALVFAAAMGIVGGFFPALRAARMSPVQAMRG